MRDPGIELPFSIELRVDIVKLTSQQPSLLPSHTLALDVPVSGGPDANLSNWVRIRHNWQLEQIPSAPIGRTRHDSRAAAAEMLAAADLLNKLGVLFDSIVYAATADIVPAGISFDPNKGVYTATPEYRKQLLRLGSPVTTPTQFFVFEVTKIDFESPINLRARIFGVGALVLVSLGSVIKVADELHGAFSLGHDGYEYIVHSRHDNKKMADAFFTQMKKEHGSGNVRTVQMCLKHLGYDPGHIDGKTGPKTRAAIVEFAKKHNLPPEVSAGDEPLLEALSEEAAAVFKLSS
jgi:Putative peptidoglycan binding domain